MKATDERYHVGLGVILDQHGGRFSFDRSATFADLWAVLFWNLIRHPLRTTVFARRYHSGRSVTQKRGSTTPEKEEGPRP
jgi:hypothetical protein